MLKRITFIGILVMLFTQYIEGQKKLIDSSVYENWPHLSLYEQPAISNNGKYVLYTVSRDGGQVQLIFQSTMDNWKVIVNISSSDNSKLFTEDGHFAVFKKTADTLGIVSLGSDSINYISNVSSFKLAKYSSVIWLAFQCRNLSKDLVLLNLKSGAKRVFGNITDYLFDDYGKLLLLKKQDDDSSGCSINLISLDRQKNYKVWKGVDANNFVFDRMASKLTFINQTVKEGKLINSPYFYDITSETGEQIDLDKNEFEQYEVTGDNLHFTADGTQIFLSFLFKPSHAILSSNCNVNIWSYKDSRIQSQQLNELRFTRSYEGVYNLKERKSFLLERADDEKIISRTATENYVLVKSKHGDGYSDYFEWYWNEDAQPTYKLIDTKSGDERIIKQKIKDCFDFNLSPAGKYVVYYCSRDKNYYSFEISSGKSENISLGISTKWTNYEQKDIPRCYSLPIGIASWLLNDRYVLVYDQYDIWQLDPRGKEKPSNITNGFGHKHNLVFKLLNNSDTKIRLDSILLLSAFNRNNKENGFYTKKLEDPGNPQCLSMSSHIYYLPQVAWFMPLKAERSNVYLVRRMSCTESPNYFITTDFKKYRQLSNIHPEENYNWMTSELVKWRTFDGTTSQGVLYKPTNFNPKKKYPVIFYFYERLSDNLNEFLQPKASDGSLDIPIFVSNGYLVVTPDIYYKVGYPGRSAYNSIVSAAITLSRKSWVDKERLGIQGHSWGGFEVNYLITHCNYFAAAVSASGASDFISGSGGLFQSASAQFIFEFNQARMGSTIWANTKGYISNSPIFYADRVKTPLLMMNNKEDQAVSFGQGLELFTALRRLGKRVWMLEYDNEGHSLSGGASLDFSKRMQQFFNYYLKDDPAPEWMIKGVPAKMKGIDDGLKLVEKKDPKTGRWVTPGPGLLKK